MFQLGFQELLTIGVLVLLFFPAEDLPGLFRTAGRWYAQIRRASDDLRRAFNSEVARVESEERLDELRKRREAQALARAEAKAKAEAARAAVPAPDAAGDPALAEPAGEPGADARAADGAAVPELAAGREPAEPDTDTPPRAPLDVPAIGDDGNPTDMAPRTVPER